MSKDKLIPELQFPEFENDGEWLEKELGQISEIVRGGSPRPIQDYLTTNSDSLNWLKIADVPSDSKYITGTKEKVIKEALSSTREVNPGDLILSNSMSFGRPYILKITTCIHDGWIAIRKISNDTFEDYLYYFISSEASQKYFNTNAAGAAVKNLNADIIKLLPVQFPKKKLEQQKIASCLSSLDEVIAAHSKKLELLKDHKKGLMQNLFPQEGEKVPKYRFKEFEKDGEWVEKTLSDVADYENGKAHEKDIDEKGDYIVVNSKFISTDGEVAKYSNTAFCLAENGDVLMVLSDVPNGRAIAKCFYVNQQNKYTVNQRICKITSFDCDSLFLYYIMNRNSYFLSFDDGVKQTNLRNDDVQSFPFLIPDDIQEQQKIASCLSSLDALIALQAKKIDQLKLHKMGLMQGLFPRLND